MRTTFSEISAKRLLRGKCQKCGKRVTRTLRAMQTLNPWNQHRNGLVKTEDDIRREVEAEADKMLRRAVRAGIRCAGHPAAPVDGKEGR